MRSSLCCTCWGQHKLGQIGSNTVSRDSVSGLCGELCDHDYVATRGEDQEHSDGVSDNPKARESHSQGSIQSAWEDDSRISGSPSSFPVLSQPPASEEFGVCQSSVLRGSGTSLYTHKGRAAVVVQIREELERESYPGTKATDDNRVRCLPARLGGSVWQHYNRGPVVTRGTIHAHKLSGVAKGLLGSENVCQRQREPEHPTPHGQHNSHLICESNGGDPFIQPLGNSRKPVAMVFTKRDKAVSRTSSGALNVWADAESCTLPSSAEWKLQESICHRVLDLLGPCQIDLFATRLNHQLPQYVSWRPDPHAVATDAFEMRWAGFQGYAFPPFSLVGRCLRKVIQEECTIILIAPVWPAEA